MRNSDFFYLIAKLVNKYNVDFENDPTYTNYERDIIRQGLRDLIYYSPYSSEKAVPEQPEAVATRAKREPVREAARK